MKMSTALAGVLLACLIGTPAAADPVKDTRQIMAGTVTTAKIKNEYLSGARDGSAAFKGALTAYKAVRAAEVPVPTPPAPIAIGSSVRASQACASVSRPADSAVAGASYTVVAFAHFADPLTSGVANSTREIVVLNDANHRGDGWFGLFVPIGCVTAAP